MSEFDGDDYLSILTLSVASVPFSSVEGVVGVSGGGVVGGASFGAAFSLSISAASSSVT